MLELWEMPSTPSLPSLQGPLWPGVVAPDKGPIYGLIELNRGFLRLLFLAFKRRISAKLISLKYDCFDS